MGTVIIFRGEAYLFEGKGAQSAVESFLRDWFTDTRDGFQVFPLCGSEKEDGMMVAESTDPQRWAGP